MRRLTLPPSATTGIDGHFTFRNLVRAIYGLHAESIGFLPLGFVSSSQIQPDFTKVDVRVVPSVNGQEINPGYVGPFDGPQAKITKSIDPDGAIHAKVIIPLTEYGVNRRQVNRSLLAYP